MRLWAGAAAALLLAGCAAAMPEVDPVQVAAQRLAAFPREKSVQAWEAYRPSELVEGGDGAPIPVAAPGQPTVSAEALDRAEAYAREQGSYAFLVARDGRIVRERYWEGFDASSRFSTASMHKTVLGLAFGPAVAADRIALDHPVGQYLEAWRDDPRGRITIGQLLRMESGLEAGGLNPDPASPGMQLMFGPDIVRTALALPAGAPPGQAFAYANADSQLAGAALAQAVGERYADWLSRTIWRPIGAEDAYLWLDREGGSPHYFCCLQATARDWLRVGELIRNRGAASGQQVVPAAWVDRMTAPSRNNPNFGLQIWRGSPHAPVRRYSSASPLTVPAREPFAREDTVFIDGAGGQRVYVIPSAGLTVVRIGRPTTEWDDSVLPNLLVAGLR